MSELQCPQCQAAAGDLMGHEVQGVYDGVLYWSCLKCGAIWPRDFGDWDRLNKASARAVAEHALALSEQWQREHPEYPGE